MSSMISNNGLPDGKGIMRPANTEKMIDVEGSANIEKSADVEKPILADIEKSVVICHKYLY